MCHTQVKHAKNMEVLEGFVAVTPSNFQLRFLMVNEFLLHDPPRFTLSLCTDSVLKME